LVLSIPSTDHTHFFFLFEHDFVEVADQRGGGLYSPGSSRKHAYVYNQFSTLQETPLNRDGFPHGPRNLDEPAQVTETATTGADNDSDDEKLKTSTTQLNGTMGETTGFSQRRRRRRSVNVSDAGNADVGVSGLYDVISQSDLAFTPDTQTDGDAVTIFQGRIREDVVYGICMPVHGFGALFVMFAGSAIVSVIVAGFQLHKYQIRRETQKIMAVQAHQHMQQHNAAANGGYIHNSLAGIMALNKLLASKTTTPQTRRNS
jgi:hypothetical protein